MSIELIVQNKVLLKDFDVLYRETLIFGYRNFEDNFRDECIKMVLKQKYVTLCGLGDWRELKEENESLESFNARFRLWSPPYFEDLKDLNNILEKRRKSHMARAMFDQHKSVFEIFQENRRYKLDYKQYRISRTVPIKANGAS
ncbi:hypothetical protein NXW78_28265 [Bacteroides ovatus]|nr:hypothetical protein [Bacteroides ovatus]